jgi:tRNA-binding protein
MNIKPEISWSDFEKIDMRVGTIIEALVFEKAKNPAYQLKIDFGETLGIKKSSAQITHLYLPEDLIGKQIIAVVNFPKKQIANFMSECLVLGIVGLSKDVMLLTSDLPSMNGLSVG